MTPVFDIVFLTAFTFAVSHDRHGPVIPGLIRRRRSVNTNCRGLIHSSNNCRRAVSTGSSLTNTVTSSPGQLHPSTAQPPPLTQFWLFVKEVLLWIIFLTNKKHTEVSFLLHCMYGLGGGGEREKERISIKCTSSFRLKNDQQFRVQWLIYFQYFHWTQRAPTQHIINHLQLMSYT
jgi:hypothetical protein